MQCENIEWEKVLVNLIPHIPSWVAHWASKHAHIDVHVGGDRTTLNIAGKKVVVNTSDFLLEMYVHSNFKFIR